MKKLAIVILIIISGISAKAQFSTTDTLRSFINRYMRNSAVESFQNLRLNTALIGLTNFVDSSYGGQVKNLYVVNDSTMNLVTIAGDTFSVVIRGVGTTNLDSLRTDTTVTIISSTGTDALIRKADTLKAGVMSALDKKKLDRIEIIQSSADLRAMNNISTNVIYRVIENKIIGDFYWDATSTATDDSVMVIQRMGITTGRFLRYYENYIMVDWFGAVPGDGTDDSYYIQKAINFAVVSPKAPVIRFGGGTYIASNLNIVKKSGSEYTFVTATLQGNASLVGGATIISVTNSDGFGMHVMIGRNVVIENITFVGQLTAPTTYAQTITWTNSQWVTGVRDDQYSPHAGIVIDGYHSSVASGDRYPGMSSSYTNNGTGGTSQMTIRNCSFKKFNVAIIESPAGVIANGDNIKAENCYFETNKICWAPCQTQSRANTIENCYFIFQREIVNGVAYGAQTGTPPAVVRCNIAGATKYLYHLNTSFSSMSWNQCFIESLFAIGKSASLPVNFTNTDIVMSNSGADGAFASPHLAEGDIVSFHGGKIGWFDNHNTAALPFYVKNLSFDGVAFLGLPINRNSTGFQALLNKTVFNNSRFIGTVGDAWQSNIYGTVDYGVAFSSNQVVMPGTKYIENNTSYDIAYESTSQKLEDILTEVNTINIDTTTGTAYFVTANPGAYAVDDVISTSSAVGWSSDDIGFTSTGVSIGSVSAISSDTIKLKYVPFGLDESTSYAIFITRPLHALPHFFGNTSNGSSSITSCHFSSITPSIGALIKGDGIPAGTRITNIVGSTVTISRNATATATGIEFYDAVFKATAKGADPSNVNPGIGFSVGDEIINSRFLPGNNNIYKWVCTSGGFTGGTPAPTWDSVKYASAGVTLSFANVGSSPNAQGASVSGSTITLQPANSSNGGVISSGNQDIAGQKNFVGNLPLKSTASSSSDRAGIVMEVNGRTAYLMNVGASYPNAPQDSMTILTGSGGTPYSGILGITGSNNVYVGNLDVYGVTSKKITMGGTTAFQDTVYLNIIDSANTAPNVVYHDPATKKLLKAPYLSFLKGTTTWTPGTIGANSSATTNVTVTGAALGDGVVVSKASGSYSNGEIYIGYVSGPNTVTIQLQNTSGGSATFSSSEVYNLIILKF